MEFCCDIFMATLVMDELIIMRLLCGAILVLFSFFKVRP